MVRGREAVSTEASNVSDIFCATRPSAAPVRGPRGWIGAPTDRWGRGPSGGAHGAGFNELFHPPLVPPLNRRFQPTVLKRAVAALHAAIDIRARASFRDDG